MKRHHLVVAAVTVIGAGLAVLSFFSSSYSHLVLAGWTIGVPAWSWFEYTFLITDTEKNDPIAFARLKYSQELGSKVWLAVTAVLTAFYLNWLPP
jgi:hypothetical protein